ncbi:MAG: hypothetical protein V1720_04065 [bacterium]
MLFEKIRKSVIIKSTGIIIPVVILLASGFITTRNTSFVSYCGSERELTLITPNSLLEVNNDLRKPDKRILPQVERIIAFEEKNTSKNLNCIANKFNFSFYKPEFRQSHLFSMLSPQFASST